MAMSKQMQKLLDDITNGWSPPPLPKDEELRRVRVIIMAICAKAVKEADRAIPSLEATLDAFVAKEQRLVAELGACA